MLINQPLWMRKRLLVLGLCALLSMIVSFTLTTATVHAELPPRPDWPPKAGKDDKPQRPLVATLLLDTSPAEKDLWSVVQWQDAKGEWQDVLGWRGTVVDGHTIWWVEEKDFGKGPYRWVIYQGEGGSLVAIGQLFDLPTKAKEQMIITVALP